MPVKQHRDSFAGYTLVCGHLSSRIRLDPDPRQSLYDRDDHSEHSAPRATTADNNRDDTPSNAVHVIAPPSALRSIQRQTLHNQGSILASDLSLIGFMRLDGVQSPPVLSRHWITMDRFPEQDTAAKGHVKEEDKAGEDRDEHNHSQRGESVDLEEDRPLAATKVEDSALAATLFPPTASNQRQHSHPHQQQHQQFQGIPHMPKMPPTSSKPSLFYHDGNTTNLSQDPRHHPHHHHQHQQSQQQGRNSPTIPQPSTKFPGGKRTDKDSEAIWNQESLPQQQLFSTLHKALDRESMVAIVALQYPEKASMRLRKWKRAQEEAAAAAALSHSVGSNKGGSGPMAAGAFMAKRLSHSQGSSPSLLNSGTSDLSASGGIGLSASASPSFGSLVGSGIISSTSTSTSLSSAAVGASGSGSGVTKDDLGSTLTLASLANVMDDRKWYGLLMVGSHFLTSPFHSAPVHLNDTFESTNFSEQFVLLVMPKNTTPTSAPWIPDFNFERPQFPTRVPILETQLLSTVPKMHDHEGVDSKRANDILQQLAVSRGMEQFGSLKSILKGIRADLTVLCGTEIQDDSPATKSRAWNVKLERRIKRSFVNLNHIEAVYKRRGGVRSATQMLNKALGNLGKGTFLHRKLSALIQSLQQPERGRMSGLKAIDSDQADSSEPDSPTKERKASWTSPLLESTAADADKSLGHVKADATVAMDGTKSSTSAVAPSYQPRIHGEHINEVANEDEEQDENLEGGSVLIRGRSNQEVDGSSRRAFEAAPAAVQPAPSDTLPQPLRPRQQQLEEDSDIEDLEQDTVLEQSSVIPQSRRVDTATGAAHASLGIQSHQQLPQQSQQQPRRVAAQHRDDDDELRIKSPGLAPQKRRRELRDDGSDDASSVEGMPRAAATLATADDAANVRSGMVPVSLSASPHVTAALESSVLVGSASSSSTLSSTGQKKTAATTVGMVTGAAKKTKRVKAEPVEEVVLQEDLLLHAPGVQTTPASMPGPRPAESEVIHVQPDQAQIVEQSQTMQQQQSKAKAGKKQIRDQEQEYIQHTHQQAQLQAQQLHEQQAQQQQAQQQHAQRQAQHQAHLQAQQQAQLHAQQQEQQEQQDQQYQAHVEA
ncbi:hypothetical protein BGZ98_001568, partial [Dissophora globulifera]